MKLCIQVQGQAHQEIVLLEEPAERLIQQQPIGLQGIVNSHPGRPQPGRFFSKKLKIGQSCQCGLPALKGKGALPLCG